MSKLLDLIRKAQNLSTETENTKEKGNDAGNVNEKIEENRNEKGNGNKNEERMQGMQGETIQYNPRQLEFVNLVQSGKSCILQGAAGTGKTTATRGALISLINSGKIPPLIFQPDNYTPHKYLHDGAPGIIITAFTKRATNNIRKVQSAELYHNCINIHKLLEYRPVIYEEYNHETGETIKKKIYEPFRNRLNPLPHTIKTVIIEEASMLSVDLFSQLKDALPWCDIQYIFIGDLNQIPPVGYPSILGYKITELPCVELKEVYRQALESPIIRLAHRCLDNNPIKGSEFEDLNKTSEGKLTLKHFKTPVGKQKALLTFASFIISAYQSSLYDPENHIILMPFNKGECGNVELNKHIAQYFAHKIRKEKTYEIISGIFTLYFSIGDKILYDKQEGVIKSITPNPLYQGKKYQKASHSLSYWGIEYSGNKNLSENAEKPHELSEEQLEQLLEQSCTEDSVRQASHKIELYIYDADYTVEISTAGDLSKLELGYAISIYKSQGSEWEKVFLFYHSSHAQQLAREFLYTAITRARESLYIICEPDTFVQGIANQRIKGETMEEKAAFFREKLKGDRLAEKID